MGMNGTREGWNLRHPVPVQKRQFHRANTRRVLVFYLWPGQPDRRPALGGAGIVKLKLTAVLDAQHGGFTTGWSPVSWGSIDELLVVSQFEIRRG